MLVTTIEYTDFGHGTSQFSRRMLFPGNNAALSRFCLLLYVRTFQGVSITSRRGRTSTMPRRRQAYRMRTLLYGADSEVRTAIHGVLAHLGHDVHLADNEEDACRVVELQSPMMIVLSGPCNEALPFCKRIRREHSSLFSIILAALHPKCFPIYERLLEAGVDDFLVEPSSNVHLTVQLAAAEQRVRDRADRMRLFEALQKERDFVSAVLKTSSALFIVLDGDGLVTMFNPACEKITGYRAEEVEGTYLWDRLIPADEVEGVKAVFDDLMHHRIPNVHNNHWAAKDGTLHLIAWTNTILQRPDGGVEAVIGTGIDISERGRIERELEARAQQQAVVARLGRLALTGDSVQDLMDYAVGAVAEALDVEFCKVLERLPDEDSFLFRAGFGQQQGSVGETRISTGSDTQAGYTLMSTGPVVVEDLRSDDRFTGAAFLRDQGIVSGMSVVIGGESSPYGVLSAHTATRRIFKDHDINFLQSVANVLAEALKWKRAEEALRESEAKARAILETTVDAMITIDVNGNIESYNSAAERIFGYAAHETIGKNVHMLMPQPYREEHDDYIQNYLETGRRKIIGIGREVTGRRKDGSTFPMDLAVSEVKLEDRRIFTGIIRDITERRRLEQEILQISEQERRRIGQDLHDGLGQMLTGTALISQNLARKLKNSGIESADEVSEITELIREADQYARSLAKGLVPVELEANGLSTALQRLATNAERLFGISCIFEEVGHALINDDVVAIHLYRITQEAVSNAVKHGKASQVKVRLATGDEQVRLYVQDNGVGFPDALHEDRGMGVRIMNYRARIIGASLEIWRDPGGGTILMCTMSRSVDEQRPARPQKSTSKSRLASS